MTWAHPQRRPGAVSFLFRFSSRSGNVFVYSFGAFRDSECKVIDPRVLIPTYMKRNLDLGDKMQAGQKPGSKPNSWDLGAHTVAPKCFFCTFLFQVWIFPNENEMDTRSILITSSG